MKNITNTLNKLTKLLAVAIFSVSLNAFSIALAPFITISTDYVSATAGTAITPVTITNTGVAASYYSISPAISNGLSFDAKTGTISGVPIAASDPVTYTVTAVLMTYTMPEVDRRGQDTATVVIAVNVGNINLAFGKHATQSSIYPYYSIFPVAGYAVDGNTDGYFLNKSTTHTSYEQGAWWQVDLGSKKNINQIIIYNRTDCCVDRLSNYQVSISNKADFSTHTYQQDFHVAPNPKKTIKLNTPGKQGRYVRIQLLDKNYLSLAEVQVMGVDPLRFAKVDYSSAHNDFGGFYNAPNYPNHKAFAALQADGSITAWGDSRYGGTGAPTDSGYTKIYSTDDSFAALKADGSIKAWGYSRYKGTVAPTDSGYTEIYSNRHAFAALKADGSITAWGSSDAGGTAHPLTVVIPRFIQLGMPLPLLKPMVQSRRGVAQVMEAQVHPLTVAIPKFIQIDMPLPLLKPMAQSRRGVTQILEAQVHPLTVAIPRFIQLGMPLPLLKPMVQSKRGVI